jgi:hypothetical protein
VTETPDPALMDVHVQAEYAPIGVQLWPTRKPEQSIHHTVRSVAVVRNEVRSWVVWTLEDNNIRTFELGDMVAARVTPEVAVQIALPQTALTLTIDEAALVRDALRLVVHGVAPGKVNPVTASAVLARLVEQI